MNPVYPYQKAPGAPQRPSEPKTRVISFELYVVYSERTTVKRYSQADGLDAGGAGGATRDCGQLGCENGERRDDRNQHPEVGYQEASQACRQERFQGGIHLAPKDLRDFFCTESAAKSDDANVAMRLMRHTSLGTTTKYMRTVEDRMREAVANLGYDSMPQKGLKCHNWPSWESFVI